MEGNSAQFTSSRKCYTFTPTVVVHSTTTETEHQVDSGPTYLGSGGRHGADVDHLPRCGAAGDTLASHMTAAAAADGNDAGQQQRQHADPHHHHDAAHTVVLHTRISTYTHARLRCIHAFICTQLSTSIYPSAT